MPRKPSPRQLAVIFLLVSAALSVLALRARNFYDDELLSLELVTSPARTIVTVASEGDVHPPGMYLLTHVAWMTTHSYRWMNLAPLAVFYAGLAVFVFSLVPAFGTTWQRLCFLALATLQPELLLWSDTFRWYSWWTGLALIVIVIALQPGRDEPRLGTGRAVLIGVLLAALFYLNYITLLFIGALACAMQLRFADCGVRWKLKRAAGVAMPFVLLAAPQARTMITVHMTHGAGQRYGLPVSLLRMAQALTASEAYLPWHPVAIAAMIVVGVLLVCGMIRLLPLRRRAGLIPDAGLRSLAWLTLVFGALVVFTGLGGKPRNGLLLVPLLAALGAVGFPAARKLLAPLMFAFLMLWSGIGAAHEIGRNGLLKATMNDRPDQVVQFIEHTAPASWNSGCVVTVTRDSALAFDLAQNPGYRGVVVSPYRGAVFAGPQQMPPAGCQTVELFVVESYVSAEVAEAYAHELKSADALITGTPSFAQFSPDPNAARKRELARVTGLGAGAGLPEFRYAVTYGSMPATEFVSMVRQMPHFRSADAIAGRSLEP